jgi:hypothetical protein
VVSENGRQGEITACRKNGRRPVGYVDWRPQRKTLVLLDQIAEILEEYEAYLPLTIRQIFYVLVGRFDYPKNENAYERLGEKLNRARRARLIRFSHIRDDDVLVSQHTCYGGIEDFHDETASRARRYRLDRQATQRQYIELWCEAAGMVDQLSRVATEFSVPVYTNGRQLSLTAIRGIANRALDRDKPTVILQVGDHDPTGVSIYERIGLDAGAFVEADAVIKTQRLEVVRVALTPEQVAEHDLPEGLPPKETDARSKGWDGPTHQLEALPPDVLAEIVREAIADRLDIVRLSNRVQEERRHRAMLLGLPPAGGTS